MRRALRFAIIVAPVFILFILHSALASLAYIAVVGLYALSQVLYLSMTFNDCKKASVELKEEIIEARKDLLSKGFNFNK